MTTHRPDPIRALIDCAHTLLTTAMDQLDELAEDQRVARSVELASRSGGYLAAVRDQIRTTGGLSRAGEWCHRHGDLPWHRHRAEDRDYRNHHGGNDFRFEEAVDWDDATPYGHDLVATDAPFNKIEFTEPEPMVIYALPGAPPTDRKVMDKDGDTWQRRADGTWKLLRSPSGDTSEMGSSWGELLTDYGPLQLVRLTEQEQADAVLYGPPGARWGNPDEPCPFYLSDPAYPAGTCHLGVGHTGPHRNEAGDELGHTEATEYDPTAAAISPQEAAETPCTCHHPERHRPGCPRYTRTTGGEQ